MELTKKKVAISIIAIILLLAVIVVVTIFAINSQYVYSPAHAEDVIKAGEICELTIEYNGADGMPEKEVKYVEAFSTYKFPKVEKSGYNFFCWFCNYVSYQDELPIYARQIRAIAQFEKDYTVVNSPCAVYTANTEFKEFDVGEYSSINLEAVDLYIEGGYAVSVYSKENFKGKEEKVYYQGIYSGKVGSMKVEKLQTESFEVASLDDNTKCNILKEYAPKLWWDEDEKYFASSVDFALEHLDRVLSPYGYMGIVSELDSVNYKTDYFYGDKDNMKAYGFIVEKEYQYIDLCYYIFFPYNKAKEILGMEFGNHVGDWEHVIVRLKMEEKDSKIYLAPVLVQYGVHSERIYMPWQDVTKEGTHVVGYIANGSHGIWPHGGKNVYKDFVIVKLTDICSEGSAWNLWEGANLETYSYDALTWEGNGLGETTWNTCFDHDFYNENSNAIARWGNFGFEYPIQLYPRLQNAPEGPTCKKGVFDYYTIDTRFYY